MPEGQGNGSSGKGRRLDKSFRRRSVGEKRLNDSLASSTRALPALLSCVRPQQERKRERESQLIQGSTTDDEDDDDEGKQQTRGCGEPTINLHANGQAAPS